MYSVFLMKFRRADCPSVKMMLSVYHVGDVVLFFFFQAEDGIRDLTVTGVQTCALPISVGREGPIIQVGAAFGSMVGQVVAMPARQRALLIAAGTGGGIAAPFYTPIGGKNGRGACWGKGEMLGVAGSLKKKKKKQYGYQ